MTCEFAFLAVGNADSIIVSPDDGLSVVVDIPKPRTVYDFLLSRERFDIGSIYITHTHRDHFAPFSEFVAFLEQWFKIGGSVKNVFIASEAYDDAFIELKELERNEPEKFKQLHHALERLQDWRLNRIHFNHPNRSLHPSYQSGALATFVLHPEQLFAAKHRANARVRLNERSLVLKITYKGFAALLLGDVEKDGLDDTLKLYTDHPEILRSHLVKIPHHGAWPVNSSSLATLLRIVNAQLAILSVGSRNSYGHVVPALFRLLNELVDDTSLRLTKFLCTEVTRTCVFSSMERKRAGIAGLVARMPCAGDIIVRVDDEAAWTLGTDTNHAAVVRSLKYAACDHRGDY